MLFSKLYFSVQTSEDWADDNVWDSGFDEESALTIDEDAVREHWMTPRFMEFVFKFAGPVSHSTRVLMEMIKDDPDNIMDIVNRDDIAWALLLWFNNLKYWTSVEEAKKRKGVMGKKKGKGRAGRPKRTKEDEDVEVEKVRQRWTGKKKPVSGEHGFDDEGIKFYENIRAVLKKVPTDEWKVVWQEYWDMEKDNHLKRGKRKQAEWKGRDDGASSDESEVDLFSSDSDEEEEGDEDDESSEDELGQVPATGV